MEEFHAIERCDLWDEREHRHPFVLVAESASRHPKPMDDAYRTVNVGSLVQRVPMRATVSDVQPGQFGDALKEFAEVLHLVPARQLDSGDLAARTSKVCEKSSVPLGSTQFDAFEGFQWPWNLRITGQNGVGEFSARLELLQAGKDVVWEQGGERGQAGNG